MKKRIGVRIGVRMGQVLAFVKQNPGLVMMRAARAVGPNGSLKYGYRTVHRAIRAGLVDTYYGPRGSTILYASGKGPVDTE